MLLLQPFNLKMNKEKNSIIIKIKISNDQVTQRGRERERQVERLLTRSRYVLFTHSHSPRTPTLRHCDACDSSEANASTRDDAEIDSSRQGHRSAENT